ncbi:uncharacterized protein LOC143283949 [Babylonia areolata]|uniref:uncharacterized protein LOC143283949 n=1 Tax=Babylonia areolata TaxID=304850 RepID=UPI003FD02992
MPKAASVDTASGEALDGNTLKKLKQHNKMVKQQREQDAIALRQKLEQWKEEKKKKTEEQKKSVKPFVTTVLKPVPPKPVNAPQNKPPAPHKPVSVPGKVVSRTTTKEPAKRPSKPVVTRVKPLSRPQQAGRGQKENCQPVGSVRGQPAMVSKPSQCPTGDRGANTKPPAHGNKRPNQGSKPPTQGSKPPTQGTKPPTQGSKPPTQGTKPPTQGSKPPTQGSKPPTQGSKPPTQGSKPPTQGTKRPTQGTKRPASEMLTPLSGHGPRFGKRHAIARFAEGMEEGQEVARPTSLAEELESAACSGEAVSEALLSSTVSQASSDALPADEKLADFDDGFQLPENENAQGNTFVYQSSTKRASRDSLTSRFRKSKHQSHPVRKSLAPVAPKTSKPMPRPPDVKKASCKSVHTGKQSMSRSGKGILKRSRGFTAGSRLGASPVLKGAASSSHVLFAQDTEKGEGAHYRKTPGKTRTEELMRWKLNQWLEAKGRTPLSLRHASCFHGDGEGEGQPRSQIKASMSVEQLSRQEKTLAKEDLQSIRKRLEWTGRKRVPASLRSSISLPKDTAGNSSSSSDDHCSTQTTVKGQQAEWRVRAGGSTTHGVDVADSRPAEGTVDRSGGRSSRKRASLGGDSEDGRRPAGTEQLDTECRKCLSALQSGALGAEDALQWLDSVREACPEVVRHAPWYRCQVAALKMLGDSDSLLGAFEQAIVHRAQPAEEMAQLLTATMKELLSEQTRSATRSDARSSRRPRSCGQVVIRESEVQEENMFQSTFVKFSVTEVTPFKKRRRATDVENRLVSVVTPVRRSARLSLATTAPSSVSKGRLPPSTPHVTEYNALEEVPSAEKEMMLFMPNFALASMLEEVSPQEVGGNRDSPGSSGLEGSAVEVAE